MKYLFLFLILLPSILLGQKLKLIKDKETHEEYYVLKSDNSIRQGKYIKFGNQHSIKIIGYYKNGVKDSVWEFYGYNGLLQQKYDYDKNGIVYYSVKDSEKDKKYKVINGSDTTEAILERPPLYIGGEQAIADYVFHTLQYPEAAKENGVMGIVNISFIIDKSGKTSNYKILNGPEHSLNEEALRCVQSIPANWLPGLLNGQPITAIYVMPIHFELR